MAYIPCQFGYTYDEWERLTTAIDQWLTEKIPHHVSGVAALL